MNNYYTAPTDNNNPSYQQTSIGNVPNYDAYIGGYMKRLKENGIDLSNLKSNDHPYKVDSYADGSVNTNPNKSNNQQYNNQSNHVSNYPLLAKTLAQTYLNNTNNKHTDNESGVCVNCQNES